MPTIAKEPLNSDVATNSYADASSTIAEGAIPANTSTKALEAMEAHRADCAAYDAATGDKAADDIKRMEYASKVATLTSKAASSAGDHYRKYLQIMDLIREIRDLDSANYASLLEDLRSGDLRALIQFYEMAPDEKRDLSTESFKRQCLLQAANARKSMTFLLPLPMDIENFVRECRKQMAKFYRELSVLTAAPVPITLSGLIEVHQAASLLMRRVDKWAAFIFWNSSIRISRR